VGARAGLAAPSSRTRQNRPRNAIKYSHATAATMPMIVAIIRSTCPIAAI